MISIVCVYNNRKDLEDCLLRSTQIQTSPPELILLDNTRREYSSAAEAFNIGGERASGKYIMFAHQDVDLISKSQLEDVEKMLDGVSDLGIAGVAGKGSTPGIVSNSTHGTPPEPMGHLQLDHPTRVQTLDECLTIVPRGVFAKLRFDSKVCSGWHLYAVEYCLGLARCGLSCYVMPSRIHHKSKGRIDKEYYEALRRLFEKYRYDVKWINTTNGNWSLSYPLAIQPHVGQLIEKWKSIRGRRQ